MSRPVRDVIYKYLSASIHSIDGYLMQDYTATYF